MARSPSAQATFDFVPPAERRPPRPPLATGYYLGNFETLLADVEARYGDLLNPEERDFLGEFRLLTRDARRLYTRLLSRRAPWFRRDGLRYVEIDCLAAFDELIRTGFAEAREPVGRESFLRLLRLEAVAVFRLLFFGNPSQDLSEFVLADLGVLRFEPVALDLERRLFANRAVVEQHLRLHRLVEAVEVADRLERGSVPREVLEAALAIAREVRDWDATTRRRRDGLLLWAGRALERAADLDGALTLYGAVEAPPARERRVRVLRRLGQAAEAASLREAIAASPRDESERIFAERGPRGRRARPNLPTRDLEVEVDLSTTIETAALRAFAGAGHTGFFAENWLWRTLSGLALWDLVFASVPGAFTHRFQYGPRDLHDGFRAAREPAVSERIAALAAQSRPGPRLLDLWDEKYGTGNRLVAFAPGLRPSLELALGVLDGPRLAAVVDRLSRDLRRYGAGFPDLFLVDSQGEILLAEVKGPGDVLRPEQEGWIDFFNRIGLPAMVVQARPRSRAMLRPRNGTPA